MILTFWIPNPSQRAARSWFPYQPWYSLSTPGTYLAAIPSSPFSLHSSQDQSLSIVPALSQDNHWCEGKTVKVHDKSEAHFRAAQTVSASPGCAMQAQPTDPLARKLIKLTEHTPWFIKVVWINMDEFSQIWEKARSISFSLSIKNL